MKSATNVFISGVTAAAAPDSALANVPQLIAATAAASRVSAAPPPPGHGALHKMCPH